MTNVAVEPTIETEGSPTFGGAYSTGEAALYIKATMPDSLAFPKLSARHIARWAREGLGGKDFLYPTRPNRPILFNFPALISFRMVAAMRAGGISGKDIRLAHSRLQEDTGWRHPFAMAPVWERTPDIFSEIRGIPAAATHFNPFGEGCHGLTFDADGQATTWSPAPEVLFDPGIVSGAPCVTGSRLTTDTLAGCQRLGDSPEYLARMYNKPLNRIEAALAWEKKLAKSAAQ